MISLLGLPPQELLDKSHAGKDYFDKHGRHFSPVSLPFPTFKAVAHRAINREAQERTQDRGDIIRSRSKGTGGR